MMPDNWHGPCADEAGNCRICGRPDDPEGHGCALATPDNERHRQTLRTLNETRYDLKLRTEQFVDLGKQADQLRADLAAMTKMFEAAQELVNLRSADLAAANHTITQLREDAARVNLRMDEAVWIIVEAGVYTDAHWKSRRAAFLASGSSTGEAVAKCYQCAATANDTCPLCGRSVCGTCAEREGESCCDTEVPPGWTKTEFDASLERLLDRPITWTDVCAECGADNRTNRGKPCVKCGEPRATEPAAPELAPAMQKPCPHRTTIIACPGIISGDGFCNKCGAKDFGEKPAAPASAQGTGERAERVRDVLLGGLATGRIHVRLDAINARLVELRELFDGECRAGQDTDNNVAKLDDRVNALYEEFVAQRKDDSELGRRIAALESCAGESWQIGKPAPFVPHRAEPTEPEAGPPPKPITDLHGELKLALLRRDSELVREINAARPAAPPQPAPAEDFDQALSKATDALDVIGTGKFSKNQPAPVGWHAFKPHSGCNAELDLCYQDGVDPKRPSYICGQPRSAAVHGTGEGNG